MKNILIYTLFIVVSLTARENPFENDFNVTGLNEQTEMIEDVNNSTFDEKIDTIDDRPMIENRDMGMMDDSRRMIENKSMDYDDDKFVPALYRVLPFVTIDVGYKSLKIKSRPKYKIIRYITLENENKVAFDFFAPIVTMAYTRYKRFNAPHFKSYIVGLHKKDGYFRVTIVLKHQFKKYDISLKNNIATIKYHK